jgi:alkyl hydroperoxide reductase subunit AhpC
VSKLQPEFTKRNCKIIGLSVDSVDDHNKWIGDINEISNTTLAYPLLDDSSRSIAKLYNMLDQENSEATTGLPLTVRSLFLIGPDKKVKVIFTYPASCGRNFNEVLRALDSVQLTANKSIVTPANWKEGDDVIIAPSVSDDAAKEKYGEFSAVKPYLRYVKADQVPK